MKNETIKLTQIVYEDFVNYKRPCLMLSTCACDWKCEKECSEVHCQNSSLAKSIVIDVDINQLIMRYISNKITSSIVFGGLEPMLQIDEIVTFIDLLRTKFECNDTVIIYTGYYPNEIQNQLSKLKKYTNIIVKFGRYLPNQQPHFDNLLGVNLASDNQYALNIEQC